MAFVLPNDDPSNPGLPAPLFADVDAVRGDQLRANDQLIWGNFDYIETNFDPEAKAAAIAALLTAFAVGADSTILAADTVLQAFGKAQGQINALKAARVKYAQLSDTQATNTAGATSTGSFTYDKRNLNTEDYDPDSIVTVSGNNFTPIAGEFIIAVRAAAYQVGYGRLKLRNVTAGTDVYFGDSEYIGSGLDAQIWVKMSTKFTANGTDAYAIYQAATTVGRTNAYGLPCNESGVSEKYLIATLIKTPV